jgi:DNA polymerase-4
MAATTPRTILHLDLDAFFCAVEEQRDPALCGKPFAVGGKPEERGVVSSCSYAARQFGVRSAMPMSRAVAICPGLIVISSHFTAYRAASAQVMARLRAVTPSIEQISIDEAFLDASDLAADGAELAAQIQAGIRSELGLPCSLGVASNKLVAKIATDVGKSAARGAGSPNAICVVPAGQEAAFLAPLPTHALWGVGPKTAERLAGMGIHSIGAIAAWPEADLARRFGKHGHDLARHARGIDDRPIVTSHSAKSISQETTFSQDVRDGEKLRQTIQTQAADISRKLKRESLVCTTVKLKLRWPDFTTPTRQITLHEPTDQAGAIGESAIRLFEQIWQSGRPVRLLGVGVSGLGAPPRQLSLWDSAPVDSEQQRRVRAALAALRERFGADVVRRASDLEAQ